MTADDPMQPLIDEFEAFISQKGLPPMSADELLLEIDDGDDESEVRAWLTDFIARWETQQDLCDRVVKTQ